MARYRRLTRDNRVQIAALHRAGLSQSAIARQLGANQGTISRELARNTGRRGYRVKQAQAMAQARYAAHGKARVLTDCLRRKIERMLRLKRLSPEQISATLAAQGVAISHESIYRVIRRDRTAGGDLWQYLRRRAKPYIKRAGKTAGRGIIPDRIDISARPAIVECKRRVGDWEADTIRGMGHTGAVLTLVDMKSKLVRLAPLPHATAAATSRATIRRLKPLGARVHTITFDNGKEFADHKTIARALNAKIYFARPYHAWERPLNENTNGLLREFFPKRMDFSKITAAEVAHVERLLNTRPRKCLGFRTPLEVFRAATRD